MLISGMVIITMDTITLMDTIMNTVTTMVYPCHLAMFPSMGIMGTSIMGMGMPMGMMQLGPFTIIRAHLDLLAFMQIFTMTKVSFTNFLAKLS